MTNEGETVESNNPTVILSELRKSCEKAGFDRLPTRPAGEKSTAERMFEDRRVRKLDDGTELHLQTLGNGTAKIKIDGQQLDVLARFWIINKSTQDSSGSAMCYLMDLNGNWYFQNSDNYTKSDNNKDNVWNRPNQISKVDIEAVRAGVFDRIAKVPEKWAKKENRRMSSESEIVTYLGLEEVSNPDKDSVYDKRSAKNLPNGSYIELQTKEHSQRESEVLTFFIGGKQIKDKIVSKLWIINQPIQGKQEAECYIQTENYGWVLQSGKRFEVAKNIPEQVQMRKQMMTDTRSNYDPKLPANRRWQITRSTPITDEIMDRKLKNFIKAA